MGGSPDRCGRTVPKNCSARSASGLITPGDNRTRIEYRNPGSGRRRLRNHPPLAQADRAGGTNTLHPYRENPPDRVIAADDIVFSISVRSWSTGRPTSGRTYVLGDDPDKLAVRDALEPVWLAGRAVFDADPDITGEELYDAVVAIAEDAGFLFGGDIAGHPSATFRTNRFPATRSPPTSPRVRRRAA